MRLQQEAELKRLRAQTNATIREAQLRGMAQTAAAAREQATGLLGRNKSGAQASEMSTSDATNDEATADAASESAPAAVATSAATADAAYDADATADGPNDSAPSNIFQYPTFTPNMGRESSRSTSMLNRAGAAAAMAYAEPVGATQSVMGQPALLGDADAMGAPMGDTQTSQGWSRRPATLGGGITGAFFSGDSDEPDGMTGTTGPRAAIRRAAEPGALLRAMNAPNPAYVQAVQDAMRELNPTNGRKVPMRELTSRVAEKLNVDESAARQIINRVREAKKTGANS